jgi:hypothetical protein
MQKKERKTKTCNYKKEAYEDATCGRTLYDDDHCIFHSEDIERKKKGFNDLFWAELDAQKKGGERFDFSGFVFPNSINFDNRVFDKKVSFYKAKFRKEALFRETNFLKGAYFSNARFSDWAVFDRAKFSGDAYFQDSKFLGMTAFTRTTFSGETNFRKAKFWQQANFDEANFFGSVNCQEVKCKDISKVTMAFTYLYDVHGLLEILEKSNRKLRVSKIRTEFLSENINIILGEKSTERYPTISRDIRDDRYLVENKKRHPGWHFLWSLTSDCGRKLWWWAVCCLIITVFFSVIFSTYYSVSPSNFQSVYVNEWCPWFSFFYYSVVTFTTLGFGDIVPKTGWLQFWVMLEVIAGYIMLGGLISIFANKLARRS